MAWGLCYFVTIYLMSPHDAISGGPWRSPSHVVCLPIVEKVKVLEWSSAQSKYGIWELMATTSSGRSSQSATHLLNPLFNQGMGFQGELHEMMFHSRHPGEERIHLTNLPCEAILNFTPNVLTGICIKPEVATAYPDTQILRYSSRVSPCPNIPKDLHWPCWAALARCGYKPCDNITTTGTNQAVGCFNVDSRAIQYNL